MSLPIFSRCAGAAALILALTAPAAARTAEPAPAQAGQPPAAEAEKKKKEPKICKRIEASGARTKAQKVCMTRAEWKKVDL